MKKIILFMLVSFLGVTAYAQKDSSSIALIDESMGKPTPNYKLFPTENFWVFLKLDTRTGQIWQVHYTVKSGSFSGELVLNSFPLVRKEEEIAGRFILYPTKNTYNFILLDQIDGRTYQVQWSLEDQSRGIIEELSRAR